MADLSWDRIRLANESMDITAACRFIEMNLGDFAIASVKTYCPFGELMHEDGGRGKAFRVYPATNSAYCFACGKAYRPCSLIATDRDISEAEAAEIILEEVGYIPPDIDSRWEAVTAEESSVDRDALANALKTACSRYAPDWETRQFDEDIATMLRKCLSASRNVTTEEEAREWLGVTKKVMSQALSASRKETV